MSYRKQSFAMNQIWHTKTVDIPVLEQALERLGMQPTEAASQDLYEQLLTIARAFMRSLISGATLREESFKHYNTLNDAAFPKYLGRCVEIHADHHMPFVRLMSEYVHENPRETYWQMRLEIAAPGQSLSLTGNCDIDCFSIVFEEDSETLFTVLMDTLARVYDYTPDIRHSKVRIYARSENWRGLVEGN